MSQHYTHTYIYTYAAAAAKSLQLCLTLHNPIDSSPPGSPVPGILQARTLEWVAISFSSAWKWKVKVKSISRVQLSDPMDCSLPGSSVHGIFQARVLEWGAIAFSNIHICMYTNTHIYIYTHMSLGDVHLYLTSKWYLPHIQDCQYSIHWDCINIKSLSFLIPHVDSFTLICGILDT